MPPAVSVLMPVYNGERFLGEAIESVLGQTFTDFEFIIVNDGSTDATPEILSSWAERDARIRLHHQSANSGLLRTLNQGCRLAVAPLIARVDSDDVCLPQRLELQVAFLAQHPDVGVIGSAVQKVDVNGTRGEIKKFPTDPSLVAWSMLFFNSLAHPTVMFRRKLLDEVGFYPDDGGVAEDYALFTLLSRATRLANLPDVLLLYRTSPNSMTGRLSVRQDADANRILAARLKSWWNLEISEKDAFLLRGLSRDQYPETPSDIRRLTQLIPELLERFVRDRSDRITDNELICRDAGVRLWLLAALSVRHLSPIFFRAAASASTISPSSLLLFAQKVSRRLVDR